MTEPRVFQVLLAEDNPADVMLVREALKQHNVACVLHVMGDGAEAIAFLEELDDSEKPRLDLVLLDMHLPKCDGEAILSRLRSSKHIGQTPVIVMTSSTAPTHRASAQQHAAMHYFLKPSDLQSYLRLGVVVEDILLGKRAGVRTGPEEPAHSGGA